MNQEEQKDYTEMLVCVYRCTKIISLIHFWSSFLTNKSLLNYFIVSTICTNNFTSGNQYNTISIWISSFFWWQNTRCGSTSALEQFASDIRQPPTASLGGPTHCLHQLLPPTRSTQYMQLRDRGHSYTLPTCNFQLYKNWFINRCLFEYIVWFYDFITVLYDFVTVLLIFLVLFFMYLCMRLSYTIKRYLIWFWLKTFLFGQQGHGAVRPALTAPYRTLTTYLLTNFVQYLYSLYMPAELWNRIMR